MLPEINIIIRVDYIISSKRQNYKKTNPYPCNLKIHNCMKPTPTYHIIHKQTMQYTYDTS